MSYRSISRLWRRQVPTKREQVIWAYRVLFDREPESESVIEHHAKKEPFSHLCESLISSEEFKLRLQKVRPNIKDIPGYFENRLAIPTIGPGLHRPIFVHSHRRSGTHFLIDTLRENFDVALNWYEVGQDFSGRLLSTPIVVKSHELAWGETLAPQGWDSRYLDWLLATAFYSFGLHLYIFRNPRHVLRSQYYFDLKGFEPRFKVDAAVTFGEYIRSPSTQYPSSGLNRIEAWCKHVSNWRARSDILLISYEGLKADMDSWLRRISGFCGMPRIEPRSVFPTGIRGSYSGAVTSSVCPDAALSNPEPLWTDADEQLLQSISARYGVSDIGYGLGLNG